jgi:hypothetical protein
VLHRLGLLVFVSLAGCHSTVTLQVPDKADLSVDENADLSAVIEDLSLPPGVDLTYLGDLSCTPLQTDCQGLCGPIFDPCTNKTIHCGACEDGGVCNLFSHTCGIPETDCNALGAECGIAKNSCGARITCPSPQPYCPAGKECDAQTNKCVTCNPTITCADYGYECGTAWLGCGDITNTVECGTCDASRVCNPFYNICEPTCSPAPQATLCAQAKLIRGVECGFISDGCGGRVKCPDCQPGFGCAAQGEQNKCQPLEKPVECVAANRNCGDITSVCGGKVHCGDCTPPDVCNANGVCGPPCTPKTCTELGNPACGFVDDGCGGQKKCNDCPAPAAEYVCLANMCCHKKKPTDFPNMCGTQIDDGCGGKLNVPCPSGTCTTSTPGQLGTCCVNTNSCNNVCNPNPVVKDSCTGATLDCSCAAIKGNNNFYCSGANGTCLAKKTCADYLAQGADGQTCSNGPSFDDGTGTLLTCGCGNRPHYCITGTAPNGMVVNGAARGICCTDSSTCPAVGMCPATRPNTCVSDAAEQQSCRGNCANGSVCDPNNNTCYNCASLAPPANGTAGAPCSNGGAVWTDPAGNNITLTCRCGTGLVCINGTMMVVSGANKGTCCQNTAVCPASSVGKCMPTGIPNNTCTGAAITGCGITCPATQHCTGPDGTCVANNNCANIGAVMSLPNPATVRGGADGHPCNDNNFYTGNPPPNFACKCNEHPNSQCTGDSAGAEGTCTCANNVCAGCNPASQDNGCGGTLNCACGGGNVCFNNACCTPHNTCGDRPAGVPAAACNYGDGCGGSVGKQCCPTTNSGTGQPIDPAAVTCVPVGGASPAYGTCVCTPNVKCPGHDGENDGCGNILHCGN